MISQQEKKKRIELKLTDDGSHTLWSSELNESYHSQFGAIQESKHIFIDHGLTPYLKLQKKTLTILEVGFGTGLNAYLTALSTNRQIEYIAIEPFPIDESSWSQLNYPSKCGDDSSLFFDSHKCDWECFFELTSSFTLMKTKTTLSDLALESEIDLIYFDPFSPSKVPELWNQKVFELLFEMMSDRSALLTYCAKGDVKRALRSAGFVVQRLRGPQGKRHMIRAIKGDWNVS